MEYKWYKFSDIADSCLGKMLDKEKNTGTFMPYLANINVRWGDFDLSDLPVMRFEKNEDSRYGIKDGDLIMCEGGEPGRCAIWRNTIPCMKIQKALHRIRVKNNNSVEYLYYWFYFAAKNGLLKGYFTETTIKHLTGEALKSVLIYLPSFDVQKSVSKVLSRIDAKIRLNKKINEYLEQQLRTIYDYWFTQFDFPDENGKPYRSSGGKMVWNEELKREIPEGWECRTLGSLLHRHQQAFDYKSEQPTIDLSIMPSSSIAIAQTNSSSVFATNLYWMNEGDLLFGSIRPYLKKAGIAPCDGVVAGTVHCFQVNDKENYNFALFTLCGKNMFDYAIKLSKGTKMPVVSAEDILSYKVPYSKEISRLFNAFSIQKTICNNVKEKHELTKLRDWLLPMLMNGQATVAD